MAISRNETGLFFPDRRRGERFPIREAVQYKLLTYGLEHLNGTGTTLNFSRSGIEFTTGAQLPVGSGIEVSVDWPAELDGHCALKFVGTGQVIRSDAQRAAVKIYHHELRTRGKSVPRQQRSG